MSDDDRSFMDKVLGRDEPSGDTRERAGDEVPAPRERHDRLPDDTHGRRDDMRVVDVPRDVPREPRTPHDDRVTHAADVTDVTGDRRVSDDPVDGRAARPADAGPATRSPDETWRDPAAGGTESTKSAQGTQGTQSTQRPVGPEGTAPVATTAPRNGTPEPHPADARAARAPADPREDRAAAPHPEGAGSYSDRLGARDPQAEPVALVPTDRAEDYRARWEGLKASFVDEPRGAVRDANELVGHVLDDVAELFARQRADLEEDLRNEQADTEQLRQALNRYRAFFDRLLTL